jgi:arginyl-tRNA synthetase
LPLKQSANIVVQHILDPIVKEGIKTIYKLDIDQIEFQETRKDFEGDITIVVFPLLKLIRGNPVDIANKIGEYLLEHSEIVVQFNVVKGFLNLVISDAYYVDFFNGISKGSNFGLVSAQDHAIMVEYSSPNTNKPLHLGHIRNNLLGYSVAEILKASGKKVYKTQIINDRGIHICKSMVAWLQFGKGETPENTGLKGDKLV